MILRELHSIKAKQAVTQQGIVSHRWLRLRSDGRVLYPEHQPPKQLVSQANDFALTLVVGRTLGDIVTLLLADQPERLLSLLNVLR
jgi:hypothetical protein